MAAQGKPYWIYLNEDNGDKSGTGSGYQSGPDRIPPCFSAAGAMHGSVRKAEGKPQAPSASSPMILSPSGTRAARLESVRTDDGSRSPNISITGISGIGRLA